jgi:osmoprotectant transport system substrate-binding protein
LARETRRVRAVGLAGLLLVFGSSLAACQAAPHRAAAAPSRPPVVVASFNFPESELLAEIYAQALEHAGIPVRRELNLGPREMVLPALHQGLIDLVPEYLGSAVAALIPAQPASLLSGSDAATLATELRTAVAAWHVRPLQWAPAENQNGLAVSRDTAARLALRTVSDLKPFAASLNLSGPTECPTRPLCLVGYEALYGLHFKNFIAYDAESQRISALQQRVVDVAVMFTTDGQLATGDPVLLTDDLRLQPPENVVPLLSDRALAPYGARLTDTINAVSAKLTSSALLSLNWRVGLGGRPLAGEATGWLVREGLIPHPG